MLPIALRTPIAVAALLLVPSALPAQNAQWQRDQQTESQVQQALTAAGTTSVLSSVKNGVVTLTGNVRSEDEKARVSESLANIDGVKTVMNNLTVSRAVQAASPKAAMLAEGTTIPIRLNGEIDTKTAKAGDTFQGTVSANVLSGATVALPTGTPVTGRVVDAKSAGRISGAAELSLELVSLQLNGQPVAITTRELSSKNAGRGTSTAARTGGGAALGAIIGGIAGGGAGAGIGAASGGVLGVGSNVLRPGQQIDLKPEALLQFQTASNLDLPATTGTANFGSGTGTGLGTHADRGMGEIPGGSDPATFDIVGLRLGMTAKQAVAAIKAKAPNATILAPEPGVPQFTPSAHYTGTFLAEAPRFKVLLTFTETYPFDPQRPEQLTTINYTANTPTAADRDTFEKAVLSKYGQPVSYTQGLGGAWCNVGTPNGPNHFICAPDVPTLTMKPSELILGDNGIAAKERAAWNRQSSGAPPL